MSSSIGDKDILQRRTSTNPRYSTVQAVVESGTTVQVAQYVRDNKIKTKRQPGELFTRIRTDPVAQHLRMQQPKTPLEDGGFAHPMDEYGGTENGEGKVPVDYLLLDCRELADYEKCHIQTALFYPRIKVHHATNPFLPEMYAMKNKPNKMIVLYDLEEESVVALANLLYEKGIDNVAIVAGGLREFAQDHDGWLTGPSPVPIVPRDTRLQRRAEEATQARSDARSSISRKPKSLSTSLARPTRKSTF